MTTLPGVYLIGAPKAGTTSVATWLAQHPDVYWSVPKEPFFWASDYPALRAHYGFDSLRSYETLFASAAARSALVRAEGSTVYLYSTDAVRDIQAAVPAARFVVCVRNPVDQVISYHRTQLASLNEDEVDLEAAWRRSLTGGQPRNARPLDPKLVDYPLVGAQAAALEQRMREGGAENFHVVVFDDLVRDPAGTYQALAAFLGLDGSVLPDFGVRNASDKMYRYHRLRRLTHRPPHALEPLMAHVRQWSRTTRLRGVQNVKRAMWRPEQKPTASTEVRGALAEHFRPDVELMSRLLGRDLAWGGQAVTTGDLPSS